MSVGIGIDIGSVSIKAAVIVSGVEHRNTVKQILGFKDFFPLESCSHGTADSGYEIILSKYRRINGRPLDEISDLLSNIIPSFKNSGLYIAFTGSGGKLASQQYNAPIVNEFSAIVEAVNLCYPDTRTIFEMGGETSKYMLLRHDLRSNKLCIIDYGTNGDCAAGTGAFMDQQSSRLNFRIEDVGRIVVKAEKSAQIAGRCSVFAKSDMIHAQQRGYKPDEVLKGLSNAVSRNFKSVISRGKNIVPPVLFIGGVARNEGIFQSVKEVFELTEKDITVPDTMCWLGAIGTALKALESEHTAESSLLGKSVAKETFPFSEKLSLENVALLRKKSSPFTFHDSPGKIPVYLGIDIGSVSTNLAVIDTDGNVVKEIYTKTQARPIEVVGNGLREIEQEIAHKIDIRGVGTTGSGRELIGMLVGSDTINDEITAHKTGALHISRKMLNTDVDTIFEIGGQDSKYISIEDGIVVDFTMNDACAAGTGSFLEEQSEELDVKIIDEFAKLALSSEHPVRLGERCTVFMGRDVNSYLQRGAEKKDVIAGLAYSVVYNYLNRVVGDRKIGDSIFFQGGTAYNDSVAAAFAKITGKKITVPPHNGVIGAIGVALLAKRTLESKGGESTFKGFDLSKIDYKLREFTCKGCSNFCTVQEFTVEGEKTYWGDKCSERYRKRKKVRKEPVIGDLVKLRETLLLKTYDNNGCAGPVVGIPQSMYTFDRLPFFNVYLAECGFCPLLSDQTNTSIAYWGIESVVAEPCYPITIAHGHIKDLIEKGVEYIWAPNIINTETDMPELESFVCVWGATLPYVAENSPAFRPHKHKFITPTLHFRDGDKIFRNELFECMNKYGVKRAVSDRAYEKATAAQLDFKLALINEGKRAIECVKESGEKAIVLIGRPYNIYDKAINLSVAMKLASIYGINVIPMDFFDIDGIRIDHVNGNMYWNYGKKILQSAVNLSNEKQFDIIYLTNFKCGPDSFIKHFVRDALGRPFLVLQFDGHSNDAGMMTRCEAYLDSKGFLQ